MVAHSPHSPAPTARIIALAVALLCALLLSGAWQALTARPAHADVQNFSYDRWHVAADIGVNDEGRATARFTETITARFPDHDQNRGLVRGIPGRYEGAPLSPRDFTVTDVAGDAVPFEIEHDDGFTAVLTGDDRYLHGVHTVVISYTLSDVILARDDGARDEFYWDLLDFEHAQQVDSFSAEVTFDAALAEQLSGDARCYAGAAGSDAECVIERGSGSAGAEPFNPAAATWSVAPLTLEAREGVTVAIGLAPGAVTQPAARLPSFALDIAPLLIAGAGLLLSAAACVSVMRMRRKRRVHRGTIVAQYDVPRQWPPLLAAELAGTSPHPVPAQIVHLAVTGALRIELESKPDGTLVRPKKQRPRLRLVDPAVAEEPLDHATVARVFSSAVPGTVFEVPRKSEKFASRMEKLRSDGRAAAFKRGYVTRVYSAVGRVLGVAGLALTAAAFALGCVAIGQRESPLAFAAILVEIVAVVLAVIGVKRHRVFTAQGAEAREYLLGVREFIRVAEADRIAMLQSVTGAERLPAGDASVVQLYERLLPYAMLFGMEKEWTRALEVQYEATPQGASFAPHWVAGTGAVGLIGVGSALESTISQFTSTFTSAAGYTASSSGGSTGGGFAGGGGGGGFSGGR
ncbi:putative membrane protein YgcG [Leucobacter exalbidus]|uniref:Membrane protein YgcG n=1 Tax=Leucobacter exalbidus TaxID=662960 RepID=A0A940PVS5_9MICO|nr:DUF2207 domain-containing protein [Leucobacter exalbidus]MBP1325106.1 putative membrane protein YgcG [Leucobacter exalbidus]